MFVDRVRIEAIAGRGGDGCMSFRRERYVPRGGPDGGDGGSGGSVVIVAKDGVNSLVNLNRRKQWKAERGKPGLGSNKHGKCGQDEVIHVPPGTMIIDAKHDFVIKDLKADGDEVVAARGGKGGKGNTRFKSSRISSAKPEIADYPFTTKFPNLGMVEVGWDTSFVVADIPGLIEGAAQGIGLGHDFLKHIERSGILVHLVEPIPMDGSDPIENYHSIRNELGKYNEQLLARPEILVVSKSELPEAEAVHSELQAATGNEVSLISAVTGSGITELTRAIKNVLDSVEDSPAKSSDEEQQNAGSPG